MKAMVDVTRPHVDSFNWMLKEGLMKAASVSEAPDLPLVSLVFCSSPFYHSNLKPTQNYE